MIAASKGYADLVYLLIQVNAKLNIKDKKGKTALFYAVSSSESGENYDVVEKLFEA